MPRGLERIAQWLKRLGQWLVVDVHPRLRPEEEAEDEFSTPKTYSQRYKETSEMPTDQIRAKIAFREWVWRSCGVAYRVLADRSDARAAARRIRSPASRKEDLRTALS